MRSQFDVLFTPIAIPPIPQKEKILQRFVGDDEYVWWKQETLLGERDPNKPFGSEAGHWHAEAIEKYPMLIKHLEAHLPFEKFIYIRMARALGNVPPHVDENYEVAPFPHHMTATSGLIRHQKENEPVGYRFIISGSRRSLYLCREYDPSYQEIYQQEKHFCHVPDQTDFFLIHNSKQPHGVDVEEKDSDRIVGFVMGFLDPQKHQALIEKSLEVFSSQVVWRDQGFL